jgi:hypothetical protein
MGNINGSELTSEHLDDIQKKQKTYFLHSIKNKKEWKQISSTPKSDSNTFSKVFVSKVVWDIRKEEPTMYLVNTNLIEFHYDFVKKCLPSTSMNKISTLLQMDLGDFNEHNYWENEERKFVLGSLIHYEEFDKFCLEINAEDNINSTKLFKLFTQLYESVYFSKDLYYKPCSNLTESIAKDIQDPTFKILSIQEIFKGITYQAYNKASCYGFIKIVKKEDFDPSSIEYSDIIVTDFVPNDIPYCSGLVTTTFQAPLCHVSILSQNRGTLNVYSKTAFEDLKNFASNNTFVKVSADSNGLKVLDCSSQKNKEKLLETQKNSNKKKIILPEVSLNSKSYVLQPKDWNVEWAGLKANHLKLFSENVELPPNTHFLQEGIVIPFKLYVEQMKKININIEKKNLKEIQDLIMKTDMNKEILNEIIQGFIELGIKERPMIMVRNLENSTFRDQVPMLKI